MNRLRNVEIKFVKGIGPTRGELLKSEFVTDPYFGVSVPTTCPGVPDELLIPAKMWQDQEAYKEAAKKLSKMFVDNFAEKYSDMPAEVIAAGPKAE